MRPVISDSGLKNRGPVAYASKKIVSVRLSSVILDRPKCFSMSGNAGAIMEDETGEMNV